MSKRMYTIFRKNLFLIMKQSKKRRAKKRRGRKNWKDMIVSIIGGLLIIVFIGIAYRLIDFREVKIDIQDVRAMRIPYETAETLYDLSVLYNLPFPELIAVFSVDNGFRQASMAEKNEQDIMQRYILNYSDIKNKYGEKALQPYVELFSKLLGEMQYFPVADVDIGKNYMYGDSYDEKWMNDSKKNYGTNIIDRENEEGRLTIVSIAAGTVVAAGFDEDDGYYVNIKTPNMSVYCYSHLHYLSEYIIEGYTVYAGEVLGKMGSSGRSEKQHSFPVRLYLQILANSSLATNEIWINPYIFLRFIE